MEVRLEHGQKVFDGMLISFDDVQGKSKKDNKEFHFLKFNIDFNLVDRDGKSYTKLIELIADPTVAGGQRFEKYKKVYCVFEIVSPTMQPKLVKVLPEIA